jgi:hypothetical protein
MNKKAMAFLQDMRRQTLAIYSNPSPICVMMACFPPLPKAIELTALDLTFPKNSTRLFLALERVRQKQVPRFKPYGTIKAVCLGAGKELCSW